MKHIVTTAVLSALCGLLFSVASYGATVSIENGSFEQPGTFTGTYQSLPAGSSVISGWTIGGAGVDLIGTYWSASDDDYSVDMNGANPGSLSQNVENLQVGEEYQITFDMAGNPDNGPVAKQLLVSIGTDSETFQFDTTGKTRANMGWEQRIFTFVADNTMNVLSFTGIGAGAWGAALDNISIVQISQVPVPASLLLFGTALGALGILRSNRRRKPAV